MVHPTGFEPVTSPFGEHKSIILPFTYNNLKNINIFRIFCISLICDLIAQS